MASLLNVQGYEPPKDWILGGSSNGVDTYFEASPGTEELDAARQQQSQG